LIFSLQFPFISRWAHEQILSAKEEILRLKDSQIAELKEQAQQLTDLYMGVPRGTPQVPKVESGATLDTSLRPSLYAPIVPEGAPEAPNKPEEKPLNPLDAEIPFSIRRRGTVYAKSVSARNSRSYNHSALKDQASKLLEQARTEGLAAVEEGRKQAKAETVAANG
jgi:hypothetical protein